MTSKLGITAADYDHIIEETYRCCPRVLDRVDDILSDLRSHIRTIDSRIYAKRNELLIAIRFVEAFRIFNWIKVCLACGSYDSVFRELRFMLDGIAQACHIDLNHVDASLACKLEVYKALGDFGGFIGSGLFEKIKGLQERAQLISLYKELSRYVHPSVEASRGWIESSAAEETVDSLKHNRYDDEMLEKTLVKCAEVGRMLKSVNSHFVKHFLQSHGSAEDF
ncbi:MAG: hypothetical protein ACLQPD_33620 [Desulfomonilaceae bacterium]